VLIALALQLQTPTAPKITRKSFNQGPKKALLAAETGEALSA
jgi:hypothetical protein